MRKFIATIALSFMMCHSASAYSPGQYVDDMWIDEGENIVVLEPTLGKPLNISGWTRRGRGEVYRVKVRAGDKLHVQISSKSAYLLLAVFDFATPDDEAIFFSEPDNRQTILSIKTDTELLIRPIYILGQPRRGLGVKYELTLERKGS